VISSLRDLRFSVVLPIPAISCNIPSTLVEENTALESLTPIREAPLFVDVEERSLLIA